LVSHLTSTKHASRVAEDTTGVWSCEHAIYDNNER
jgi:hypothetical protein